MLTVRFRARLVLSSLRRLVDRWAGIDARCEGCRRVLIVRGAAVQPVRFDVEGVELCVPCWRAL